MNFRAQGSDIHPVPVLPCLAVLAKWLFSVRCPGSGGRLAGWTCVCVSVGRPVVLEPRALGFVVPWVPVFPQVLVLLRSLVLRRFCVVAPARAPFCCTVALFGYAPLALLRCTLFCSAPPLPFVLYAEPQSVLLRTP